MKQIWFDNCCNFHLVFFMFFFLSLLKVVLSNESEVEYCNQKKLTTVQNVTK